MIEFREAARALRREPDEAMLARIRAGVRARVTAPPSLWDILAAWLRPAAISFVAIVALFAVVFTLGSDTISPDEIATLASRMFVEEVSFGGR